MHLVNRPMAVEKNIITERRILKSLANSWSRPPGRWLHAFTVSVGSGPGLWTGLTQCVCSHHAVEPHQCYFAQRARARGTRSASHGPAPRVLLVASFLVDAGVIICWFEPFAVSTGITQVRRSAPTAQLGAIVVVASDKRHRQLRMLEHFFLHNCLWSVRTSI